MPHRITSLKLLLSEQVKVVQGILMLMRFMTGKIIIIIGICSLTCMRMLIMLTVLQLAQPYMGMWLASHATLTKWMQHDFWDKDTALKADIEIGLGYPERSNGMFMLIDVPKGFQTSNLVPYDPIERVLLSEARIFHERNGYSTQPTSQFAKLEEHAVFSSSK